MSYKDFVAITFTPSQHDFSVGEVITGELRVENKSEIALNIENIEVRLVLKHQGKGETNSIVIHKYVEKTIKTLAVGGVATLEVGLAAVTTVTYNGYNLTQSILVDTKVDIAKETERLLRKEKLSDFKIGGYLSGVFRPDFYNETPVVITKSKANYSLVTGQGVIKPGVKMATIILFIGLIIFVICGIVFYNVFQDEMAIYGTIGGYAILFGVVYYLKIGPYLAIGAIHFELQNLEDQRYGVKLYTKKRSQIIYEISYHLMAKEFVTYDNGSRRSTATHIFYKEPIKTLRGRFGGMNGEGRFPSNTLPVSIKNNDFEIRWIFTIEIRTKANLKLKGAAKIELAYDNLLKT